MLHSLSLLGVTALGLFQSTCAGAQSPQGSEGEGTSHVPSDYYASANGKKGKALKMALGEIVQQHTVFGYGELWYHYQVTDVVPGTDDQVFDYYSPVVHYFPGGGGAASGMNKEHACPQSWWGGGAGCDAYSDLFNVMPSEVNANSAKSNFPVGVVGSNVKYENACMKVGTSALHDYPGSVFEPCDEYKGDFARLYFYVATCYANAAWGMKESVANTVAFLREDYPTIKNWLIDLLLEWNAQDPVSEWEVIRNERVYGEQGNRNPFIDYPQLADYIWGDSVQYNFDFASAIVNGNGSGNGSGVVPGEGGDDQPVNPGTGDDPAGGEVALGTVLLSEDFSSLTEGNDVETSSSSTVWTGNEHFPNVSSAFQAGGAVRLGSSKKAGSLSSCLLNNAQGTKLSVVIRVKGWTTVEGQLLVGLSGMEEQTVSYSATMSDAYETVTVTFDHCPANARLTIGTSAKRAFITNVTVGIEGNNAVAQVLSDQPALLASTFTLTGQPVKGTASGLLVRNGRIITVEK